MYIRKVCKAFIYKGLLVLESHKMGTKRGQNKHHKYTIKPPQKRMQKSCKRVAKKHDNFTTKARQKNVANTLQKRSRKQTKSRQKRDRMGGASNGKITC